MKKLRRIVGSVVLLNLPWHLPTADAQANRTQIDNSNTQTASESFDLLLDEPRLSTKSQERYIPRPLTRVSAGKVSNSRLTAASDGPTEVVVQRYPNGRPHIERNVKLDSEGNYVNHGDYQEWSETGDLLMTGGYANGYQHGPWIRFCTTRDSDLFSKEPYSKFKAPFQSTVEYVQGQMDGFWTISDKDGKTVSQIQFREGQRNGTAVWYHVTGVPLWQSEYRDGILDGVFTEKDPNGKVVREIHYNSGRKMERKQEFHANKKLKTEFEQYGPIQSLRSPDDWNRNRLATYELDGDAIKSGIHTTFFDTGSIRSTATYREGKLDGRFESWYPNGQKEVSGLYELGVQEGQWDWWHPNGMKKSSVTYASGEALGEPIAWNDSGKRVQGDLSIATYSKQPEPLPEKDQAGATRRPGASERTAGSSRRKSTY